MQEEAVAEEVGAEPEEVEAEQVETEEPEAEEAEAEQADGDDTDDTEEEVEEEPEEIEFNFHGKKLRVPKGSIPDELATQVDEFVRNAESVTARKLQDVAEKVKSAEAREAVADKLLSINNEALDAYSRGLQLKAEIERLEAVDLYALRQSDPDKARWVSDELAIKRSEFQKSVNQVSQKEAELSNAQKAEIARRKSEGEAAIEKQIKGFKTEKLPAIIDYAVNTLGMPKDAAENDWALNPAITIAVHKAMLWDQAQASAKSAKPKPAQAQPVKPQKPKGQTRNTLDLVKDASKMSTEEWVRRRNQQLAKGA